MISSSDFMLKSTDFMPDWISIFSVFQTPTNLL